MNAQGHDAKVPNCPSQDMLSAFAYGNLPLDVLETLASHIGSCPKCAAVVDDVGLANSSLISQLRNIAPVDNRDEEPECDRLQKRAEEVAGKVRQRSIPDVIPGLVPQVPGYASMERLSKGTFGPLYRAIQTESGQPVVLREVPLWASGRKSRLRFLTQAALASRLTWGLVVPVLHVAETPHAWYLVYPYRDGDNLRTTLHQRRAVQQKRLVSAANPWTGLATELYLARLLRILAHVIAAVATIHAAGGRYRELRPSNIVLDPYGRAWLTDFGLSRLYGWRKTENEAVISAARQGPGSSEVFRILASSPGFIAPEEWRAERNIGQTADVFRVGVLLYQAVTLELPYGIAPPHDAASLIAPRTKQALLAPEIEEIILTCLALDPSRRYPSAVEVDHQFAPLVASLGS